MAAKTKSVHMSGIQADKEAMAFPANGLSCDSVARRLLWAFHRGDLSSVDNQLDAIAAGMYSQNGLAVEEAERHELLKAIACALDSGIERMNRGWAAHLEAGEACLELLGHLARTPAVPAGNST